MRIENITLNKVIAENVIVADNFFTRLKGLMFTKELDKNTCMIIRPCNSIHTFNMNYAIDVLYLDKYNEIISIDEDVKPRRVCKMVKHAVAVVELNSGIIKDKGIKVGHKIQIMVYQGEC